MLHISHNLPPLHEDLSWLASPFFSWKFWSLFQLPSYFTRSVVLRLNWNLYLFQCRLYQFGLGERRRKTLSVFSSIFLIFLFHFAVFSWLTHFLAPLCRCCRCCRCCWTTSTTIGQLAISCKYVRAGSGADSMQPARWFFTTIATCKWLLSTNAGTRTPK